MEPSEEIAKLRATVGALTNATQEHAGKLVALEVVLLTLVETHPNRALLLSALESRMPPVEATFVGESRSETALQSFLAVSQRAVDLCRGPHRGQPPDK